MSTWPLHSNGLEALANLGCQGVCSLLGITKEHLGVLLVEDGVVQVRVAAAHGPLAEDHLLGAPDLNHGHAPDRATFNLLRRGVHHVIGADDEHQVVGLHVRIHLVHLHDPLMRNAGLGQQHVHLSWHAACHGVDSKLEVDLMAVADGRNVSHRSLSMRHRHAVPWNNKDLLGVRDHLRNCGNAGLRVLLRCTVATLCHRHVVDATEEDVEDVAVHGVAHDLRQDGTAEANERAHDGERRALQQESLGHQGPAGVGI
mmetsp:Transcript_152256/g.369774  ORF Transcript_152256/g.369774 Transcript_152256/m.369774 type:complete len:257 (+) Transcript_152256:169-939(+)